MEIGYSLSSEELRPTDLVRWAARADESGFRSVWVSDHFHPWIDAQGQSPFVWSVIGGIAATTGLRVGTSVTCPLIRTHPAIIAHAAATSAAMAPGRFFLGVGTGEALNEHVHGDRWPPIDVRLEMLEEAVDVMRELWRGGLTSHEGKHYRVENARLYTLPDDPVPVYVSGFGEKATTLAGRIGDGYINTSPDRELVEVFERAGGRGKPKLAGAKICWAEDEASARRTAFELWPTSGVSGQLSQELHLPSHFEQAAELVTEDKVAETIPCGPDPERVLESLREYEQAGFDEVYEYLAVIAMIAERRAGDVFASVARLADGGVDFGVFLSGLGDMIRAQLAVILNGRMEGLSPHALDALETHREEFSAGDLVRMLSMLSAIEPQFRRSTQQQLLVEMLLVRFALLDRAVSIEEVLQTLGGAPRNGGNQGSPRPAEPRRPPQTESRPPQRSDTRQSDTQRPIAPVIDMPTEAVRTTPAPPIKVTPPTAQKSVDSPGGADWKTRLEQSASSGSRPVRLTTEAVREERLRMLRAQDPLFDAAVRELDLDLLD